MDYDVIVVGAGPAGSTAALVLARAGRRVALIERLAFPRPKICGNCLNPRTWELWEQLGLAGSFRALPHADLEGFTVSCEGKPVHRETFHPPQRGPRAVARDLLDDWLRREAQAAGAEFLPETAVTNVHPDGRVETSAGTFSAKLVFGADGRNSVVARQAGLMPPPRRCPRVAWQATMPIPPGLDHHVHMQIYEEGYFGFCRYSPDRAVVSMVVDSRASHDPLPIARRFFPDFPEQEWLRMNPITRAPAEPGRGRLWLVGDAARVVEPFTGEGIAFALATGLMAGEKAHLALARDQIGAGLAAYRQAHRKLYRQRLWVNTLVRSVLTHPRRTVRFLRHFPPPKTLISRLARIVHS